MYTLYTLIVLAAFSLPFLGTHRLISAEKRRQQREASQRLELMIRKVYQGIDRDDLAGAVDINSTLISLFKTRDLLEKIPTWPWQIGTIRGLVTAILLPLALWLVQQFLSRFLGP